MMLPGRLLRDTAGAAVTEFALVAPVALMTVLGVLDLGQSMYTASLLHGAIEQAARNSSIEAAVTGTLDSRVTDIVRRIAPGATTAFSRKAYANFANVKQPEDFTDTNADNACDNGEPFEDANGNGAWDADRGRSATGGARDAILYTVTVTYPRLLPAWKLLGQSSTMTMTSAAVLRNQPYGLQSTATVAGVCP